MVFLTLLTMFRLVKLIFLPTITVTQRERRATEWSWRVITRRLMTKRVTMEVLRRWWRWLRVNDESCDAAVAVSDLEEGEIGNNLLAASDEKADHGGGGGRR